MNASGSSRLRVSLTRSLAQAPQVYLSVRPSPYEIGSAALDMSKLQDDANQEDVDIKILKDGKERGEIRFDLSFFPVLKPSKTDAKEDELQDTSSVDIPPYS